MSGIPKRKVETIDDYLARPEHHRAELEVFRRLALAYALVLTALRDQRVEAEPFEAVELRVDELLGADPEEDE